jgi:hypothetical protein
MSKLFSYYSDNVDHAWYDSTNVIYSECIDNKDDFKTLKVVFSNGTQYEYEGVSVNDYLLFREAPSQGQALNKLIKTNNSGYKKLDNVDLKLINEEYISRRDNNFFVENTIENGFIIRNLTNNIVYSNEGKIFDNDMMETITTILSSVGVRFKVDKNEADKV